MGKRTLLDLAEELEARAKSLPQETSEFASKVVFTIVTDLAWQTPVDESTALSNWIVSLGAAGRSFIPAHFQGTRGSTQSSSVQQTIAEAKAVLKAKVPGQTVYISNNTPYIRDLNDGTSRQAPAGFVERATLLARKRAEAEYGKRSGGVR